MMEAINHFLAKAYDTIGLQVLNDAAKNVPAVRLAGAALFLAMFAAAAVAAFQSNVRLLVAAVIIFVVLIALLIILGAAAKQGNQGQAKFFSWVIVALLAAVLAGVTTSFLFEYPKPLNELLLGDAAISLKDITVAIERDADNNLIVTTSGIPRQPYILDVQLHDTTSKTLLAEVQLPLRNAGDVTNPTRILKVGQGVNEVNCVLILTRSGRVVDTRPIVTKITSPVQ